MSNQVYACDYLVHFHDTDAAGVVYFANVLRICHQAYENSLFQAGFDLKSFFQNDSFALPIIHAEVDFFCPLFCGDQLSINLTPHIVTNKIFQIDYEIIKNSSISVKAQTKHMAIAINTRKSQDLPTEILKWINPDEKLFN